MGAYSPKFFLLEKRPTGQNFYGTQRFMTENQRANKQKDLEKQRRALGKKNLEMED